MPTKKVKDTLNSAFCFKDLFMPFLYSAGRVRNIYFPFDIEADTALTVAMEMVAELCITEHDVTRIAESIDGEISKLVPEWKPGLGIEEMATTFSCQNLCYNYRTNSSSFDSFLDYHSFEFE